MQCDDLLALIMVIVTMPLLRLPFPRVYCDDPTLTEFDEQHLIRDHHTHQSAFAVDSPSQ